MSDLKGKLERFEKLQSAYDDAETLLLMIEEENDPSLLGEGEEAVANVEKAVDELQLLTMLSGQYDHNNAILTFHAGTGGTKIQDIQTSRFLFGGKGQFVLPHRYSILRSGLQIK